MHQKHLSIEFYVQNALYFSIQVIKPNVPGLLCHFYTRLKFNSQNADLKTQQQHNKEPFMFSVSTEN